MEDSVAQHTAIDHKTDCGVQRSKVTVNSRECDILGLNFITSGTHMH